MKDAQELYDRLSNAADRQCRRCRDLPRSVTRTAQWVQAGAALRGCIHGMDGRRPHPASFFSGIARGQKAQGGDHGKARRGEATRLPERKKDERLDVLGVAISHPDRVIFEDTGMTKGQLAEFYAAAAPWMLKDFAGHPLSLLRCPEGTKGDCFYQRSPGHGPGPGHQAVPLEAQGQVLRIPLYRKRKGTDRSWRRWAPSNCIRGARRSSASTIPTG